MFVVSKWVGVYFSYAMTKKKNTAFSTVYIKYEKKIQLFSWKRNGQIGAVVIWQKKNPTVLFGNGNVYI